MVETTQTMTAVFVLLGMLAIAILVPVLTFRHRTKVQREREDKAYAKGVRYFNHTNETDFEGRLHHLAVCVVKANDDLNGNLEQSNHAAGVLDAFLEFCQGNPADGQAVLDLLPQARQQVDELETKTDSDSIKQLLINASSNCEHECKPSLSYMIGRINKEQENDRN